MEDKKETVEPTRNYRREGKLGEGTSGVVFKARVLDSSRLKKRKRGTEVKKDDFVAIKRINLTSIDKGLSMETIREIRLLPELNHPNIVSILDIFKHNDNVNLVMEYMEMDLAEMIQNKAKYELTSADKKAYMKMMLESVAYCHKHWVLHRDLKPQNYLIAFDGSLHLTDFGLAKGYGSPGRMTPEAYTVWYRPPELLFDAESYGPAADMWAVGCVFGELLLRRPLFATQEGTALAQISAIFGRLGTPTDKEWPDWRHLKWFQMYEEHEKVEPVPWRSTFSAASDDEIDLIKNLLRYNPHKRLTAEQALKHRYFSTAPEATSLENMPNVRRRRGRD
mmetsp:Transcript_40515/g.65853  ORF Transcript_40515/g.65853 Transcript_40515/m.65853 type:complete len:336 (+) Transcript_40515:89-1096(+)